MGYPLSRAKLFGAVCSKAMDYLFNPKQTIERLSKKVSETVPSK
jgi:hypothetical protein